MAPNHDNEWDLVLADRVRHGATDVSGFREVSPTFAIEPPTSLFVAAIGLYGAIIVVFSPGYPHEAATDAKG